MLTHCTSIADAIRDYLRKRRRMRIVEKLNRTYSKAPGMDERRLVRKLRAKLPRQDQW